MNIRIFSLLAIVFFTGCASNPMAVSIQQELQRPQSNESQVIFLRSSFLGSAIGSSLYDVTNGDIKFLGVLANGTKLSYKTTSGKHVFMVVAEAADFMEADLDSGKNYFSIATPRMGLWKARFSLWPIKKDPGAKFHTEMPEFNKWISNTKLVSNTDMSRVWYERNKESVNSKYKKYWPEWQNITAENLLKRTLEPKDGM